MFEIGDTARVVGNGKRLALALIVGTATLHGTSPSAWQRPGILENPSSGRAGAPHTGQG